MTRIPSKAEILQWISDNPTQTAKRDIARAFGVKGAARIDLKRLLREMEDEGALAKRKKTYREPGVLPPVTVLKVTGPDDAGDLLAHPAIWEGEGNPPAILIETRPGDPALGAGDRVLARLTATPESEHPYTAAPIRRIAASARTVLGIFRKGSEGGRILPIDKGETREWGVAPGAEGGARDGELVEGEAAGPKHRMGLPQARITQRLGDPAAPKAVSLIAIHQHGIPDHFPDAVLAEAEAAREPGLEGREDMRDLPLVTIDPEDARDHDDAVAAWPDPDPGNPGGHVLVVAIADVAHYVRPASALDREARKRGNSVYFPDRVVPMLPDHLSGDLCSLHEGVDRPCIALRMRITARGQKIGHGFSRAMMRSAASLSYHEVQAAQDGQPTERTAPLMERVITPLFAAYEALAQARRDRQPLDIDLPERRIVLSDEGRVTSVAFRERLEAHRLIEEFMVLANVAAAETLVEKRTPLLFRVHEEPKPDKLEALREVAEAAGLTLAKGQVLRTEHLNRLLSQAEGTDHDELINLATLRAMTQAYYNAENFGHFGLSLAKYAHFTSPIRRYSDLVVHRGLISAHRWGPDGLSPAEIETLDKTATHISDMERRAMMAERDTTDRYLAAFLSDRIGAEFGGRISGIARFGLFVKLDETGADGLVPIRTLGDEFFHFDAESQTLLGADSGTLITVGQRVTVRLSEAVPISGGLLLELLTLDERDLPRVASRSRGPAPRRKAGAAKARDKAAQRKVKRTRR
ncbi:MAG: ribonuclease R [Rubellimicrobium sp.]|nr:ribonuclease R [Rubellimicrobium sp.]